MGPTSDWLRASTTGGRLSAVVRSGGRWLADVVWPPVCAHCSSAVEAPDALCGGCWRRLTFIERPYCERLGTPFATDIGGTLLSPDAIANPPTFDRARAAVCFDDIARALVHRHKYGDDAHLAQTLGRMMARAGAELLVDADLLVPVPLHRFRLWRRRFNQAALLAEVAASLSGKPLVLNGLVRRKPTPPQVGLSRAARAANMSGAFHAPPALRHMFEGKRALLVDDVLTTGSTVNAAAGALRRAGAVHVDVLTFARVVGPP